MNSSEYRKAWRKKRTKEGYCYSCGNLSAPERNLCPQCLAKRRYKNKLHYYKYKALGLCIDCWKHPVFVGNLCGLCRHKRNVKKREHYLLNREAILADLNYRKQEYLLNNRCYRCGSPLIEDEIKYCFACLARDRGTK